MEIRHAHLSDGAETSTSGGVMHGTFETIVGSNGGRAWGVTAPTPAHLTIDPSLGATDGPSPLHITMPCGAVAEYWEVPREDQPCTCGNPDHYFIKYGAA